MEDKLDEVLQKYDFNVASKSRIRGAVLIDTDKGFKLVKETRSSAGRLVWENRVKNHLRNNGFKRIDAYCINNEGNISTPDMYGVRYTVSDWYIGNECNLNDVKQVYLASKNLGELHIKLDGFETDSDCMQPVQPEITARFEKHNVELKHIRNYLKNRNDRNEFEIRLLKAYPSFYAEAEEAVSKLGKVTGWNTYKVIHGSYTYHNLIMCQDGIATTVFDKSRYGPRLMDLYYFLRKVMEKNEWAFEYGMAVMSGYESYRRLEENEMRALKLLLLYPEKFWKLASYYMNSKKTWMSQKNLEKLDALEKQRLNRHKFIDEIS